MSFKGMSYETIFDMERTIFIEEARRDLYLIKYKTFVKQGNSIAAEETLFALNLQNKCVDELKERYRVLKECIRKLETQVNDLEYQVFVARFIEGKSVEMIKYELAISDATLYRYLKTIKDRLARTEYGKVIDKTLLEDKPHLKPFRFMDGKLYPKGAKPSKKA